LHLASGYGHLEVVQYLVKKGKLTTKDVLIPWEGRNSFQIANDREQFHVTDWFTEKFGIIGVEGVLD
jgi:hypothetical protein